MAGTEMSLSISLKHPIAGLDIQAFRGSALAEATPALAAIARGLGVVPLAQLTSASAEQAEALLEAGPGLDRSRLQESWFDPALGLLTVRALLAHLRDNRQDVPNGELVLAELTACEDLLMRAQRAAVPFHFTADA
jgi:hypothetical protein